MPYSVCIPRKPGFPLPAFARRFTLYLLHLVARYVPDRGSAGASRGITKPTAKVRERAITRSMAKLTIEPDDLVPALLAALKHPDVLRALAAGDRPPPAEPPRYMTPKEYSARLRVSERTVRKWQRRGLPVVRVGSVVRVRVLEADAWLAGGAGVRAAVLRTLREVEARRASA
jgi:excisionase family DNA binding protein